jgi:NAD(P)-dependent dehydrogenase (short-subunit alcohol dehydrogenase family)
VGRVVAGGTDWPVRSARTVASAAMGSDNANRTDRDDTGPDEPDLDHTGRSVLVTGGTKGIGRTIVQRYLDWGADVMTCGRNEPDDLPRGAGFMAADVRDPEQADALVDEVVARHGRIDVVVNNAGGAPPSDAATASSRFSESIIRLNLIAPLNVAQRANHHMQNQGEGDSVGGVIINIASVSGTRPSPGTAAYGAAKAGLLNLTQTLAVEWAPKVRVVAVVAGMILTEQAELYYGDEESVARVAATVPAGRLGTPEDIAQACRWLGSDLASYVSGSAIWLHGGGERPAFLGAVEGGD